MEPSLLPAEGSDARVPTQIVHTSPPLVLLDAFFLANALKAMAFAGDALWIGAGAVAGRGYYIVYNWRRAGAAYSMIVYCRIYKYSTAL